jgi:hypothetical protein
MKIKMDLSKLFVIIFVCLFITTMLYWSGWIGYSENRYIWYKDALSLCSATDDIKLNNLCFLLESENRKCFQYTNYECNMGELINNIKNYSWEWSKTSYLNAWDFTINNILWLDYLFEL